MISEKNYYKYIQDKFVKKHCEDFREAAKRKKILELCYRIQMSIKI